MMSKNLCSDKDGLKKGPWTQEEDQKLIDYIRKHGHGRWRTLPKHAGLKRCGKSCRLRWTNYLRPDIKRGRFSFEEDETIIQLHSVLGNKWSMIASRLPGRTDNEIKNYWNTNIRKRLLKMGIDPITHTPRLDLLELSTLLNSTLYNSQSSISQNPNNYLFGNMGQLESSQNLLNLATTLMSYHPKSATSIGFVPQNNVQETLVLDEQHVPQSKFQYFQQNQIQNPTIPELIQAPETSTTSGKNSTHIVPCLNETQLMQAKIDQLSQTLMSSYSTTNTNATISSTKWKNNVQAQQDDGFMANNTVLTGYQDSTQSSPITDYLLRNNNQEFFSCSATENFANSSFTSLISTPSMSHYRNYSCSTDTSREDNQGDGFLSSNMFMYDADNFSYTNHANELV